MDCFKVLEISPTNDVKIIKRAYSTKLRVCSPETDPEGFKVLRAAYEEALQKASQEEGESGKPMTPVEEFMKRFEDNYNNFMKRIDTSTWKELLESDICYNIDTGKEISERILAFLMDNYSLPHEVWVLFNTYFSWVAKKEKLYLQYPKNFIDFVIYKITSKDYFRYEKLMGCPDGTQENFINEHNKGCHAIDDYDLYAAMKAIDAANEICPDHPDLVILKSRYLSTNGKLDEAKSMLDELINKEPDDLYAHSYRGNLHFRLGNFQAAYEDYKKAIEIKDDFIDVLFSIGKCCISIGKYEEAIEHLEKLRDMLQYNREVRVLIGCAYQFRVEQLEVSMKENPEDTDVKIKLAEAYLASNRIEDSYGVLSQLEQSDKMNNESYLLYSKVLLAMEKKELAYTVVNRALEIYPDDYDLTVYKACIIDEFGRYEESLQFYDKAIEKKPDDALTHNNRAFALNKLERFKEALESAQKSISIDPKMAHAYKNKAEALLGLELYEECIETCEEALNIYLYLIDIYVIKMKLLTRVGQYEEALNIFSRAAEYGLSDSRLFLEKANVMRIYERFDDAIGLCDQAIAMDENSTDAYYSKGVCFFNKDNYQDAINCLNKVIELDNKYEVAYYYKALSLLNMNEHNEALKEIDKAIALNHRITDRFHKLKGDVYSNQNNYKMAIEEYKKAIKLSPSHALYHYVAGSALNNAKEYQESLLYLNKAIELDPSMIDAYIDKSHTLYCIGDYQKCVAQCNLALDINPNYLLAYQNKAWALYKLGQINEAEESCNNGLKIDGNYENLLNLKLLILKDKGLYNEALIVTDRLLEINPGDEGILGVREELLRKIGPKKGLLDSLFGKR
ncbi:tetratricopeptide repeat protein [Pseudobacteroides cellulosolvens]|uniref:Tetratricopeptide TPR_1 repeat-containing protein n=1 Tax=Pseudobacteroides cellulosolvens ATCC 35603 = DSM 2933 TaxID=398512 RepID=A0A0L6JUS9_9FIRM|nr:tetratricopeptide repeat protein [Pseudobacteroides cellulosolvens]KNY29182.1 Tetratricopeptide TPR_1 repeat-containing protein [Pseudobacteroides cellulosolvens ATCC 35603 = DSM 2933]